MFSMLRMFPVLLRTIPAALLAVALLSPPPAPAFSDWIAVYSIIDKVVFEPNDAAPERVQLWGDFALARPNDRNFYDAPQRGYLYLSLVPGKEDACRREWNDFRTLAGTGQVVGFGGRNAPRVRVRKAGEKVDKPDVYPMAYGLIKMNDRPTNYEPIRELRALPRPQRSK